jgi:hypothetical protein
MAWLGYLQIAYADLWGGPDAISRFRRERHDPGTRIIDVNLGITRVYSGKSDAIPTSKLDEVFDSHDGNLKRKVSVTPIHLWTQRTLSMAGCREKNRMRPVGERAI